MLQLWTPHELFVSILSFLFQLWDFYLLHVLGFLSG